MLVELILHYIFYLVCDLVCLKILDGFVRKHIYYLKRDMSPSSKPVLIYIVSTRHDDNCDWGT